MDENKKENGTSFKRLINVSNSFFDKKIWRKITIKQLFVGISGVLLSLGIAIIFFVFVNVLAGLLAIIIGLLITFGLVIKNCLVITIFWFFFRWLFTVKNRNVKKPNSHKGVVRFKNKKLLFFEIECEPLIGSDDMIQSKVDKFVSQFSKLTNFSIINTILPFAKLKENTNYIDNKINDYFAIRKYNKYDFELLNNQEKIKSDIILKNLLMNKVLVEKYVQGDLAKNTFLLAFEINDQSSLNHLLDDIKVINKSLDSQGFKIQAIDDETFDFVLNELFLFDKKIKVAKDYIKQGENYYHFIKVEALPSFVELGYLDFLNDLSDSETEVSFTINTYPLKNIKKEEKVWENAISFAEAELNRAKKYKEQVRAENDFAAAMEVTQELVSSASVTQKYEIIIRLRCNNVRNINIAKRRIRQILRKQHGFELEYSGFNQYSLLEDYQRNFLNEKANKKINRILPNYLTLWSYPFFVGNTYSTSGLFLGELFNKNPLFFSLNAGQKENNSTIIVGKTGSGKSTFMNWLVKNNMSELNVDTLLIDPKGEYSISDEIKRMNPKIINLDNDNDLVLNPFELCSDENESFADRIDFILTFLKTWFEDSWNLPIKNKISYALETILANPENYKWNIDCLYEVLNNTLDHKKDREDKLIIETIEKLTSKGIYKYFSKPTSEQKYSRLTIFNISSILSNFSVLNKVKLLLLFRYLKQYIYKKENLLDTNKRKIQVLVDEFPAIANPTAPFVVTEFVSLIRLIRSYDASLVLAMQDMARFESLDAGSNESLKSIANNVKHMFIMQLNHEQLQIAKRIWGDSVELSQEEEKEITQEFGKGDILCISGNSRFYFNATYPLSLYSDFDRETINEDINNYIDLLIKTKDIKLVDTSESDEIINEDTIKQNNVIDYSELKQIGKLTFDTSTLTKVWTIEFNKTKQNKIPKISLFKKKKDKKVEEIQTKENDEVHESSQEENGLSFLNNRELDWVDLKEYYELKRKRESANE